eukprot:GFUD01101401.1.p1 GENE.GFUD01101401.1~~GFUD01101401.1.p1  ORF type:complete len:324 (+),score=96.49 GFUD01101401.1:55-1026(+)
MPKKKKNKATKLDASADDALDLDEIDQACREIENEVAFREKKKRGKESLRDKIESSNHTNTTPSAKNRRESTERQSMQESACKESKTKEEKSEDWVMKTVSVVVEHLNKFGACVIDDFLGEAKGVDILKEVLHLQKLEMFQEGQLASAKVAEKSIRSDKITWTDGVSPPCPNIKYLINTLDSIVLSANKSPNNGVLSNYNISGRTKAMVACYPGEGTHYVKHVDNPNKDGRCITAIYYLNRDWDPERDGGALKIYSACVKGVVAQVDPLFDRIIFFWSDRRNPHEVLPAFRERYAITVWYMDEKEKRDFEEKKRLIPEQEEKS